MLQIKVANEKHEITMVQLKEAHRTQAEELSELNEALDTVEVMKCNELSSSPAAAVLPLVQHLMRC